jgi:hypothetical protein
MISRRSKRVFMIVTSALAISGTPALLYAAQFPNLGSALDALNRAKQQIQQQQPQQQQPQQQTPSYPAPDSQGPTAGVQTVAANNASAPAGDCCSAEAQQKSATAASFLDIVGIKLGMTPEQVTAAIKAYNPNYKLWVVNTRLERPSAPGLARVPRYIFVHSPAMNPSLGQVESITIQFTTPPNRPVVQEIERYVVFHVGEPVLASNLMDSFRKKYGQENAGNPGEPIWVYDANGKLLTQVPNAALNCQPSGNVISVIEQSDPTHDAQDGGLNLSTSVPDNVNLGRSSGCIPYLYVEAWDTGVRPNEQITQFRVSIRSGALTYNSLTATHNWLQAEADAKAKQQQDAASQRKGPAL